MESVVILAERHDPASPMIDLGVRLARSIGGRMACLYLEPAPTSTAEWLDRLPPGARKKLKRSRSSLPIGEWVRLQEGLVRNELYEAASARANLKRRLSAVGMPTECRRVAPTAEALLQEMAELQPIRLLIGGELRLPTGMAALGITSIEDLGRYLQCDAVDSMVMEHWCRRRSPGLWARLLVYATAAALLYLLGFPHFGEWNHFYMSGGILPAVAILATAGLSAWIWGEAMESLFRVIKLNIY